MTVSKNYNISPFEVLREDTELVIMCINYFIEQGDKTPVEKTERDANGNEIKRVKVTSKTATGGWW